MGAYLAMFGAPAACALFGLGRERRLARLNALLLAATFAACLAAIGLRDGIGADWLGYLALVRTVEYERLGTAISHYDPAFNAAAWACGQLGWGLYGVDTLCGLLLLAGIFRLAGTCPDPWLAITAAIPYLVIVVGMGYIRQSAAIGLVLLAYGHLERGRSARFVLALGGALTFHVAALVLVPLIGLVLARRSLLLAVAMAGIGAAVFAYVLAARLDAMRSIYLAGQLDSGGALVRLAMTAVPAALFLALRGRFAIPQPLKGIWTLMAATAVALPAVFLVSPSSTAVDRIGLFLAPLQVLVVGHLPAVIGRGRGEAQLVTLAAVAGCAVVLVVWLRFSVYARFWVPYRWLL